VPIIGAGIPAYAYGSLGFLAGVVVSALVLFAPVGYHQAKLLLAGIRWR